MSNRDAVLEWEPFHLGTHERGFSKGWGVTAIDEHGSGIMYQVEFLSHDAEGLAREYADFKNSQSGPIEFGGGAHPRPSPCSSDTPSSKKLPGSDYYSDV